MAAIPTDSVLPGDRRQFELARFFAAAGSRARGRELLAAAVATDSLFGRDLKAERSWTRGVLALADGNLVEAVAELRQAAYLHVCPICPLPDLARAYEAAGRPAEAMTVYERYLTTPWTFRYVPDAVELGRAMMRLGELRLQRGDKAKAVESNRSLLALWKHADPEVQAVIQDVRREMAELGETD